MKGGEFMEKHPIEGLMSEAMDHIRQLVDVNTIVGNPVTTPDGTTIIPISRVAFGFGAGGSEFSPAPKSDAKSNGEALFGGGSGGGVSISPVAFLVANSEQIKLLPVTKSVSTADKLIDLVPEVISKLNKMANEFIDKRAAKKAEESADEISL